MGKYLFPRLTDEFSAVVSEHGYYEIQRAETYNSYASGIGPVYHHRTGERLPDPVVIWSGSVEDLGLEYDPRLDTLAFDGRDAEDDGHSVIRERLLAFIATRSGTEPQ